MGRDFLREIMDYKQDLIRRKRPFYDRLRDRLTSTPHTRYRMFRQQVSRKGAVNLIAEIKKASPSKGLIRDDFDAVAIGRVYHNHGAAAISVLTEDKYFLGKPDYLEKVSEAVSLPVLMKDFILDEGQIYEAHLLGASAVLLIAACLEPQRLAELRETAANLDIDALVEVHNDEELALALDGGADIIGVNNRDLTTFGVSLETSQRLLPRIPEGVVRIAESGIETHGDILQLQDCGADAVLVGETLMRAADIGAKIDELLKGGMK